MFGRPTQKSNAVLSRLRDLGVLAFLGLSMLVSAALSAFANAATGQLLDWLGMSPDGLAGRIICLSWASSSSSLSMWRSTSCCCGC